MSLQDPVADMLTRIRNAYMRSQRAVVVSASRLNEQIAAVMEEEGYIDGYLRGDDTGPYEMTIQLRYVDGKPSIRQLRRLSRPSLRLYHKSGEIPRIRGGLGIVVMSTSQGVMSSRRAREKGIGGEALCSIF